MTSMEFAPDTGRIPAQHFIEAPNEGAFLVDEIVAIEQSFALPAYEKPVEDGDQTRVYYRKSDGPNNFIFLLGSCTNGEQVLPHIVELFGDRGSVSVVDYPRTFLDINETKSALMRSLVEHESKDRNKETVLITHSLGNPIADTIMLDEHARKQIGDIQRWGRDSGFTHWDQLRAKVQKAIEFGEQHGDNPLVAALYSVGAMVAAMKNGITYSGMVDAALPRKHLRSSSAMGWQTRRSHFPVIRNFNFVDNSLAAAGQHIGEIYTLTTAYDDVVDTSVASDEVRRLYNKPSMVLANVALRNEHGVFMEHPETMLNMVDGVYSEQYQSGVPRIEVSPDSRTIRRTGYFAPLFRRS